VAEVVVRRWGRGARGTHETTGLASLNPPDSACPLRPESDRKSSKRDPSSCAIRDRRTASAQKEKPPRGGQSLIGHTPDCQAVA
jgi:hypothetical protein